MKRCFANALACALAMLCGAAQAAGEAIPFKRDGGLGSPDMSAGALGILGISLLAIGAVWMVRKRLNMVQGAAGVGVAVRIVETQRLGPKALLTVVEFDGRRHLLAHTEHGVNCLVSGAAPGEPQ